MRTLESETRYLEVLRRELANVIVSDDPAKMVAAYYKAGEFEREMSASASSRVDAELDVLTERYPIYDEFDLLNVRHFIPYSDAANGCGEDAVEERYLNISKFMILRNVKAKASRPIFSEKESETLRNSMQRENDRRFRAKIEDAMITYNVARSADKDRSFEREGRAVRFYLIEGSGRPGELEVVKPHSLQAVYRWLQDLPWQIERTVMSSV